ncbi:C2 domain-containing protein [Panicum miliaceum]|uniref:C2 domain-containing protein n=1 Tax=Panicum miliaceum TaxID=4540 RepID=A0A3L6Q8F2_PANMI|nr:C2 domain-containing protein [Panicum miliaceum]
MAEATHALWSIGPIRGAAGSYRVVAAARQRGLPTAPSSIAQDRSGRWGTERDRSNGVGALHFAASIPLEAVFQEGSLPPTVHPVVKEEKYCGEIKLALTFTPAVKTPRPDNEEGTYSSWN